MVYVGRYPVTSRGTSMTSIIIIFTQNEQNVNQYLKDSGCSCILGNETGGKITEK